jgi:hypothetical protein
MPRTPTNSSAPKLPSSLSDVAVAYFEGYAARFDLKARADDETLRATLAKLKIEPWPVLFEIERDFGGLCFAEGGGDWLLGAYAIAKKAPRMKNTRARPVPLVCIGVNDTGPLYVDEAGQIWDADEAAGSLRLRADGMARRMEREAYGLRIHELRQGVHYEILPSSVAAAAGAKKLGLPLIRKASDAFERVWQSDEFTVLKTTDDVRVFATSAAGLAKALAAVRPARG